MLYICYAFIFRVESAHWKLKQMLGNSLGDMVNCWEAMNNNLRIQIGNICASFQKRFYEVEHAHVSPLYGNLRSFVSIAALRRIAQELKRVDYVGTSREICGCTHRTNYGLPCACELGRYVLSGVPIPIESVHDHWRKLSMEGELQAEGEDGSETDMNNVMEEIWRKYRSSDVVGKRALRSRCSEIAYPATTSLCPPPDKIKTKGGVKKKGKKPVGYDVYRDPSQHEYVEQASQTSQKLSQKSQSKRDSKSKKPAQQDYTLQFPSHIRSYIFIMH